MRARTIAALVVAAAALGCGETLVDHNAPVDLIGAPGGVCDPAACPSPDPAFTGARAACIGSPGAQICGYECTGGLLKCSAGCCQAAIVAAGGAHTCAITGSPAPGALYCWGANDQGQVNTVRSGPVLTPQKRFEGGVSAVAVGTSHTCAIVNGGIECWGRDNELQAPSTKNDLGNPRALAAGTTHTCALDGSSVKCWGSGAAAAAAPIGSSAVAISSGADHACALVGDQVQCWGAGALGQLGIPSPPISTSLPQTVTVLGSGGTAAIAAGSNLSCAAAKSPTGAPLTALQCWGKGLGALTAPYGLLSADPQLTPDVPRQGTATALVDFAVSQVSVGRAHVCVKAAGTQPIWCLASENAAGQIGGPMQAPLFTQVRGPLIATTFAAGADHTCAVIDTGGVFCWGLNDMGQLGDGTQITPNVDDPRLGTPVAVSGR